MSFTREITRLMFGLLIVFFIVVGSAGYWAIVGADSILLREDNPRLVEDEASIQRGSIYSADGILLAENIDSEDAFPERIYHYPESYSALGYFSFRYGVGGAEAAYNDYLRGELAQDSLNEVIQQDLLHQAQVGADIRLTLDLDVQQTMFELMQEYRGAAVVLSVPDGAVLGLLSLPTFDPNSLDEEWEILVEAEGNPFFNRVLQGQYQPGGMLQTPLMVANILSNQPFDTITANADRTVEVDGTELGCAVEPESPDLSYTEAYAYGCPFPFSLIANQMSPATLQNIFGAFRLNSPPLIEGYVLDNPVENAETTPEATPELSLVEDIIGQGELTINPLGMAGIASAVINTGNAPQPYLLEAYQDSDGTWISIPSPASNTPLMTANAARRLRELMINNTTMGASVNAAHPDLIIGGHTALAISGDETQTWFIGFASLDNNRGVAIAIVLENTANADETARIAGLILESATNALRDSDS